jgi:hypothetical protein
MMIRGFPWVAGVILAGCASLQPPTWTARVTGTPCAGFTGSYTVLVPNGATSTNSVSGVIPCSGDAVEYSVGAGARILSAAFVNTTGAELRAELRQNRAVVAVGSTSARYGVVALTAP